MDNLLLNLGLFLVSLAVVVSQFTDGGGVPNSLWATVTLLGWVLVLAATAMALLGYSRAQWGQPRNPA